MLNLIPWNRGRGPALARALAGARARDRAAHERAGVLTQLRQSAGQDVEGGCGQLRARERAGARPCAACKRA
jgi:23S rRNA (adenine2503-C2)-methyltransferase